MRLSIIPNSPVPVYRQLYEEILSQVISGELKGGTALPPIRTVSKELGVSVITVRSAWEALENDGIIFTKAGSGCFTASADDEAIKKLRAKAVSEQIKALVETARKLGFKDRELAELVTEEFNR